MGPKKLGAVKVPQTVDFAQESPIVAKAPISSNPLKKPTSPTLSQPSSTNSNSNNNKPVVKDDAIDRLGMGVRKMNLTQASTASGASVSAKCKQGISASAVYGSGSGDQEREREIDDKLRSMDPSKGISSDMFFGKASPAFSNDDYDNGHYDDEDSDHTYSSNNSQYYSNIKSSAKNLASKLAEKAASIDYNGMKKSIASAGSRLSSYLQDLQNNQK